MKGRIHSVESLGTVDGPGLRFVVFLQGCLLRCRYCHNPDTWKMNGGKEVTPEEIINEAKTYLPFMKSTNGGITVTGGEPLLQIDFLTEVFRLAKAEGMHTTVDTSGGSYGTEYVNQEQLMKLIQVTDLFLLDLKHIDPEHHKNLTGVGNEHILEFAKFLSNHNKPIWVRYVLIPGVTDDEDHLIKMGKFICQLSNVEKVEVLPYHKLGEYKWESLNMPYTLKGIQPPTKEAVQKAHQLLTSQ